MDRLQGSSNWSATVHEVSATFSPTNAQHLERQKNIPPPPTSQHRQAQSQTPITGELSDVTNISRSGGDALPSSGLVHPWWARRGQAQCAAAGHVGCDCSSPACQIGVSCPWPRAAISWGPVDGGGQCTKPAGTKQQVAPAEVIRIIFNGGASSIFSPVSAEGPGAALLMLQGTRGTH